MTANLVLCDGLKAILVVGWAIGGIGSSSVVEESSMRIKRYNWVNKPGKLLDAIESPNWLAFSFSEPTCQPVTF
jgi:hypothetical protein